ncbi:hybrid sensor histidine kinase/response regulator [Pontibacter sp. JH31]|uniref:histidine kinase n=1 Tax=Pontibacter aquaedesilientis TaxID=2766980 RepID=A0ABR7XBH4_9BACT|nr:hybrid sensor histidine kinase/response regulator [Pontibacter aquaedesilientis]MBD1395657.1 hybrid sensor histidine kinase/response regulator [Pontibacter aquaedesilientis]
MNTDHDIMSPVLETALQPVRILLVDDKEENLVSLASLLSEEGDDVSYLFANSGEEALKVALQEELALILLDVQMPGMNGYEVARYLRDISKTRDIPIIFVTAISQQDAHVIEGFEAGAVDFLFKPLHPYITKAKVMSFVRYYQQKKELERAYRLAFEVNRELEERVAERTRELTRVNKDLDNFVYTASHDLKAPINNIEGLVVALKETLQSEQPDQAELTAIMGMIQHAIGRFKNTLIDLTEVAKVQYEEEAPKESVQFEEILKDVKLNIKDLINRYDARIQTDFTAAPNIVFSRKNLRSIVYNLVSNAIKYSSPERMPEIEISSFYSAGFTVFRVRDNGLGLREEDKQKVFGMFKRLHTHVEGTGVGMAIVQRIVENYDGKIELDSELGKGTEFRVYLRS